MKKSIGLVIACLLVSLVAEAADLVIPAGRRITWEGNVGVQGGIPTDWANCTTTACNTLWNNGTGGAQVTISNINAALTSASGSSTVVRIPSGTFSVNGTIDISGITYAILRGQGMGVTILNNASTSTQITTGQASNVFGVNYDGSVGTARAVSSGYTKGSTQITVADASSIVAGRMMRIVQENDTYVRSCVLGEDPRLLGQNAIITSVVGNTINFYPPLMMDFTSGLNPVLSVSESVPRRVGFEDFTLNATGHPDYVAEIWRSIEIWFQGVEITGFADTGIYFFRSTNSTARKCKIHGAYGSADGYGISMYNWSSGLLVENNLFYDQIYVGPYGTGATASVVAYNYITGNDIDAFQIPAFKANHHPHGMFILYEGNVGNQFQDDGYHGSASHNTLFRNNIHGVAPWAGVPTQNRKMVDIGRWGTSYNVIGNVLGSATWSPTGYQMSGDIADYVPSYIYRLGYPDMGGNSTTDTSGRCGNPVNLDTNVQTTLLRHKNYDYYNNAQRVCGGETEGCQSASNVSSGDTIPDSLYMSSKPAWFGSLSWPPVNPSTPSVGDIPAKVFYDTGSWPSSYSDGSSSSISMSGGTTSGGIMH